MIAKCLSFLMLLSFPLLAFSGQSTYPAPGPGRNAYTAAPVDTASYVQGCQNYSSTSGIINLSCSLSGVVASDLIVVCSSWTESWTTANVSDGTSNLTPLTSTENTTVGTYGECFYLLSANSGTRTYTATYSGLGSAYAEIWVAEFHGTGAAWHYDTSNQAANNSTSLNSGSITTAHSTGEVIVANSKLSTLPATTSNPLIGSVTPTEFPWSPIGTYDHQYYLLNTSITSGAMTSTYSTSTDWVSNIAAFYTQ